MDLQDFINMGADANSLFTVIVDGEITYQGENGFEAYDAVEWGDGFVHITSIGHATFVKGEITYLQLY